MGGKISYKSCPTGVLPHLIYLAFIQPTYLSGKKKDWAGFTKKKDVEEVKNGKKRTCNILEWKLRNEPRRYNSKQLSEVLAKERGITLSSDRLRRILKKRG